MIRFVYIITAAAIAAVIIVLPSLSMQVEARGPALGVRGDRIDARPIGTACSQHEWPYFEAACVRDPRRPFGEARQVRVIPIDRLPQLAEAAQR
jgi:hypothetical protein